MLNIKGLFDFGFLFKKNNIIFVIVLLIGMVIGSICLGLISSDTSEKLNFLLINDLKTKNSGFNKLNFICSVGTSMTFVVSMIIFALSFLGPLAMFIIIFLRGFGLGLIMGCIYVFYYFKGIIFCIFILLPGVFLSSVGIILIASQSFNFSIKFTSKILPNSNSLPLWPEFLDYIKNVTFSMIFVLFAALIDFTLLGLFCRFFEF
ncbi:MAG: stage II sporulation protein M [Candidatus Improbicoccus devescovinae]|nr:MAG: stage II sporulation protein M [Candidatus Improbicoccus devescovinae]